MIHTSIRVAANGDTVIQGIASEDVSAHIWYNMNYRCGQLLIVDRILHHMGYYSKEAALSVHEKYKDVVAAELTKPPYH